MSTVVSEDAPTGDPETPGTKPTALVRRWLPWLLLVAVAVVGLVIGLHGRSAKPTLDQQVNHIASELKCPVCDGETVAESSAAPSVQIRDEIRQDLINGEPSSKIISGFEASYGPGIIEKPSTKGIGLLVWLLPLVGVLLGGAGLVLALRRWRGSPPATGEPASPGAGPEPPVVGSDVPTGGAVRSGPGLNTATPGQSASSGESASLVGSESVPSGGSESEAGAGPAASAPGSTRTRRARAKLAVSSAGVLLIVAGGTWVLIGSTGHRLPGEQITGNALGADQVEADLLAAQSDEQKNPPDEPGAVKEYQDVLASVPDQVEALTGEGWLLTGTGEPALVQQGLEMLQKAETVEPDYAPAHVYRGLALYGEGDYVSSVPELQWYLAHSPDPSLTADVKRVLAEAQADAKTEGKGQPAG